MKALRKWWVMPVFIGAFFIGQHFYKMPKFSEEEKTPNFEWTTSNGEQFDLRKLEGKYVLIDFWGTWCGPCRAEFPGLKFLFDKYQNKKFKNADGFEIVAVGVQKESQKESWKKAIQRFSLNWDHHVFDAGTNLRFFNSPIAKLYGIKEVPSKYLLDENGLVIKVNPKLEEIEEFLSTQ